jgi:hypothetical protein
LAAIGLILNSILNSKPVGRTDTAVPLLLPSSCHSRSITCTPDHVSPGRCFPILI